MSAKLRADIEDVVDTDPFWVVFAPKLLVLLCTDSPLLSPLTAPPPGICSGGSFLLPWAFSLGVCEVPMGVARLSFGGCCLCGMDSGGIAEFSDMGGAAALLTGR